MKALSLHQPWASAIALGLKRIETRSWHVSHRGEIAIHAALRASSEQRRFFDEMMRHREFKHAFEAAGFFSFEMLPKGAIVALAELKEVVPTTVVLGCDAASAMDLRLGDYGPGRFAWRLANARRVPPFWVKGNRGLFNFDDKWLTK
jgi:hypothetical protein